ncbi:MAG: hypothetical protein FJ202_10760 [Gemmatimonadetes bacterium]|nr:hypothetical protein [Gemmatimonadota bacterium]
MPPPGAAAGPPPPPRPPPPPPSLPPAAPAAASRSDANTIASFPANRAGPSFLSFVNVSCRVVERPPLVETI